MEISLDNSYVDIGAETCVIPSHGVITDAYETMKNVLHLSFTVLCFSSCKN